MNFQDQYMKGIKVGSRNEFSAKYLDKIVANKILVKCINNVTEILGKPIRCSQVKTYSRESIVT